MQAYIEKDTCKKGIFLFPSSVLNGKLVILKNGLACLLNHGQKYE